MTIETYEVDTVLTSLMRLQNTPSGNPRWMVRTPALSCQTVPDSARIQEVTPEMVGKKVRLIVNSHNQHIRAIEVRS